MDILSLEIAKTIGIFGLSMVSFWAAIPTALALGFNPLAIILITSSSYASSVLLFIVPARFIRKWMLKRFGNHIERSTRCDSVVMRLWRQYGVIGFGLIAPIVTGAYLGAMIGIALNIPRKRLTLWMIVGVFAWSAILTFGGLAGVTLIAA